MTNFYALEIFVFLLRRLRFVAYSAKELSEMGCGSESHIRRMIKSGQIPIVQPGNRALVAANWVEETFFKPSKAE